MSSALETLRYELEELRAELLVLADSSGQVLAGVHDRHRLSAVNLVHYIALRKHDIREMQDRLAAIGLSSLGRSEPHVLDSLEAVIGLLRNLVGLQSAVQEPKPTVTREQGRQLLVRNTDELLGPPPEKRSVRIMVTMPGEAATTYTLVRDLLVSGMNCMRINCAHDGTDAWAAMIRNLRTAEQETGRKCKVEMDLGGPKLRTGPMEAGPAVLKLRPRRDALGRVSEPARVWLVPTNAPRSAVAGLGVSLPVPQRWLDKLTAGDRVRFTDARGARRCLVITGVHGGNCLAEGMQTCYLVPGTVLTAVCQHRTRRPERARVGPLPSRPQFISLRPGDTLVLTRSLEPGRCARTTAAGEVLEPARIGVTLPEFFDSVRPGDPIWLDDGKIGGIISEASGDQVSVKIQHAKEEGAKLGPEKGINLPQTVLKTASLTQEDLAVLKFAAKHADLVGYSFVRTAADVRLLQDQLDQLGASELGIMLKIETREGFDNLPNLLLAAMARSKVGVMIARGDLAVECGYERLAEAQEEILWISEASHVPVVWATQVLETLAKTGTPSRSEITDAAMGERAECVMLNKGPHIVAAVRALDDILRRMQAHQEKKRAKLRRLGLAVGFTEFAGADAGQPATGRRHGTSESKTRQARCVD